METFDYGTRKARKDHKCSYCNGLIKKGEEYEYSVHKMDDVYTWKAHKHCSELVNLLNLEPDMNEGITHDDFYEYINDYFHSEFSLADKAKLAYERLNIGENNEKNNE